MMGLYLGGGGGGGGGGGPSRAFSLEWPASMQIYWKKESVYMRKDFNSQMFFLVHQHSRRFIVLEHQNGRHDVMWKRSIREGGYKQQFTVSQ